MFCSKKTMQTGLSKQISGFDPRSIGSCQLWLDAADTGTMNSTPTVTTWNDKSGNGNNMTGTATWSGSNMTFDGSTQAFSNTGFVFPSNAYSMFAVYSNTTAPAAGAYMNVVYGNGGYPMLGTYDTGKYVTARSVAANTGGVGTTGTATAKGWATRITGTTTSTDQGLGVATDSSGNVFVTGLYTAALTLYNTGGGTGATLAFTGGNDCFLAKYSSAGSVVWAAQIAGTTTSSDYGQAVATDSSGNVFVTGLYGAALTLYNTGGGTGATLAFTGGNDCFLAKYSSAGSVVWAAQIAGTTTSSDVGNGVATDSSGNVFVTGYYQAALTLYNTGGTTGATLAFTGGNDCFLAKYSSAGSVVWATRIAGTTTSVDYGNGVATDSSGNVFVTGQYGAALTLYNTGGGTGATLAFTGGTDAFLAKYSSAGSVVWAAQIAGTTTSADVGQAVATDSSGNVFVTGTYGAALTLYNTGGGTGATLAYSGGTDAFFAKYSSAGSVLWATRIASTGADNAPGIATDSSGNVFVCGQYSSNPTLYNTGGTTGATLPYTGSLSDAFLAKYSSAGSVLWATQIVSTGYDYAQGVATDSSGNVFVTGMYTAALTLYDTGGSTSNTLAFTGGFDAYLAKYSPNGFGTGTTTIYSGFFSASSTTLVSALYTPSTVSPFVNGTTFQTITGTTAAATGLFIGGPSNYFNGSLAELLIYASTLSTAQRQAVEGYLTWKWNLRSSFLVSHPLYATPPFMQAFRPIDITGCRLWMDAADPSTMNSSTTVTSWSDKSGNANTMTGTATYSGGTMTFNGSTQAFSNTGFVFPNTAYSMFAVYSNTTAPAGAAYMNVVYGNGGYPMVGTYDTGKLVSARSLSTNTGAVNTAGGWATRIASTAGDVGQAVATDSSGNVFVTGLYKAALTLYNIDGTTGATLAFTGGNDVFLAKYSSAGSVVWAAQITGTTTSGDVGYGVATDSSGNVFVTGMYGAALTLYNTGGGTGATLAYTGGSDVFLAKYSSAGSVLWAAQITGTTTSSDVGNGVATDSAGGVFVTGYYGAGLTLYNTGGTTGATLPYTGSLTDAFLAKYSSGGSVVWAAQIAGTSSDVGNGVATDSSGNVFVTGYYGAALTLYNTGGGTGATLATVNGNDCFLAKYSSAGSVLWAAQIAGIGGDGGYGVATDSSGNVFVTGYYNVAALTLYNTGGTTGATLAWTGGADAFLAKYSSAGSVLWATRITGTGTSSDTGYGVATDSSGNVFVTGTYGAALTLYNTGGTTGATLAFAGVQDVFLAKYSSAGSVLWAAQIGGTGSDAGYGVATDSSGNVFVTGSYGAALTLYNTDGTTGNTLALAGGTDAFFAKYSSDGFILKTVPASSNVLVSGTYTPSTFSPFINGSTALGLSGTTAAATGLFIGGPSNYFNGSLSELVIYAATLTTAQRQLLEGYLAKKWGLNSSLISTQPYKTYAFPITSTVSSNFTIS